MAAEPQLRGGFVTGFRYRPRRVLGRISGGVSFLLWRMMRVVLDFCDGSGGGFWGFRGGSGGRFRTPGAGFAAFVADQGVVLGFRGE